MPNQSACTLCGQPIFFAHIAESDETVKLDVVPVYDGAWRLVGDSEADVVERITRPGFYGYPDHEQTCPAKTIH